MDNNEGPEPASTVGKPTEWDKKFFDLIHFISFHREQKRTLLFYGNNLEKYCPRCGDFHHELAVFNFYNN